MAAQPAFPTVLVGFLTHHVLGKSACFLDHDIQLTFTVSSVNSLWGHWLEYKFEKNAIQQKRLLSEKRSTFAYYNLTLSEFFYLTDHENKAKSSWHMKSWPKMSQKEVIRKNAYKAPKPQNVLLPAVYLKFSTSLTNFQASPARQSSTSDRNRKIDLQTTLSSWSQLELSAGKPFTSSSANQTSRQKLHTTPLQAAGWAEAQLQRAKRQLFLQNKGLFKASAGSLVSQLHAHEKWRRYGSQNYQKIRLECT